MNIIDELFLGGLKPMWKMPIQNGYAEALLRVAEAEKALAISDEDQKKKVRDYRQPCDALLLLVKQERFQVGFKLGAQMMLEPIK